MTLTTRLRGVVRRCLGSAPVNPSPYTGPHVPLTPAHLAGVTVLVDRAALLERLPSGGVVAEIGVADGAFTAEIVARTHPKQLHLIDAWEQARYEADEATVRATFQDAIATGTVHVHRGRSTAVLPSFPAATFDWVYLDTDHSYATTAAELAVLADRIKPGGLIAGHDFTLGNWGTGLRYGVIEAVREFCVTRDWVFRYLTFEWHGYYSFAIQARQP